MASRFTIGQLARRAAVPASTIRYYERSGLLRPAGRTASNYRFYDLAAVERLGFIRAAQATGFALDDVKTLLALRDGETLPCKEVQELIEERIAGVKERLESLRHVEIVLRSALSQCKELENSGQCKVIEDLKRSASSVHVLSNRLLLKKVPTRP